MKKVLMVAVALAFANMAHTAVATPLAKSAVGGNRQSAMGNTPWLAALKCMPLEGHVTELDRTNCIPVMLNAFESNAVVKALIFMPGATDELYFYRRAHAKLSSPNSSLADAIIALTQQTYIQATFRPPFLLLRTTEDPLDPIAIVRDKAVASRLQARTVAGRFVFNDCEWDRLRAALRRKLSVSLRPFSNSPDSWHFYRNNFAACGLTQWQLLQAIALSGQTTFTVHWLTVDFRLDTRAGPTPGF
ncbi:MAG TPA: hypothetical protein VGV18_01595 [Verrucomicrobiae bacterium]|nr:hypothetical protein [Verrucomicrobiae bacterium]